MHVLILGGGSCNFEPCFTGGSVIFMPMGGGGPCVFLSTAFPNAPPPPPSFYTFWPVPNFRITCKILKQAVAYNPSSKRCNLCLWEKYFIFCKPYLATLNKHNELVSSCRRASKFLLKNFKSSSVTQ